MRRSLATFALLALFAAGALTFLVRGFLRDPPALTWDEGVHLADALDAYRALTSGSLKDFLLWLDEPRYYPFVHPLAVALGWLAGGTSETVARVVSAAFAFLLLPAVLLLARETLDPITWRPAAVVAAALTVSAPAALRGLGLVMLDLAGAAVTTLALVAWVRWLRVASWPRALLAVSALLLAFFTKYNYGVVLGAAMALHGVVARAGWRRLYQAALLLAAPTLLWLYQEPGKKLEILSGYLWNRSIEMPLYRQISYPLVAFATELAWWPAGVVGLAAFLWSWRRIDPGSPAGILLVLPLVQALAQAASTNQQPRYLLPAAPAAHLAAASVLAGWAGTGRHRRRLGGLAVAALAIPLFLPPDRILDAPAFTLRHPLREAVSAIERHFAGRPLLLVGGLNELPPSAGRFLGVRHALRKSGRFDPGAPPLLLAPPPAYRYTRERLLLLGAAGSAAPLRQALAAYLDAWGGPVPIVVLRLDPGSPLRGQDYDRYNAWQEPLADAVEQSGARLTDTVRPPAAGLTARFYLWPDRPPGAAAGASRSSSRAE